MSVRGARHTITTAMLRLDGVAQHPHRFGGVEFRLGKRELGHIHGDHLVDIPFPTPVRDELVRDGIAEPHHIMPDSGWVSVYLRNDADVARAIDLLTRAWSLARNRGRRHPPTSQE